MLGLRETNPVPARTLWLVRGWQTEGCFRNPIGLLNETLADHGREAYDFLLAEMFRILRKRFGVKSCDKMHIVVKPGYWFQPYPPIKKGEDTMQMEGNAIIHPLPKEAIGEGN
jgi:hypothetical protein